MMLTLEHAAHGTRHRVRVRSLIRHAKCPSCGRLALELDDVAIPRTDGVWRCAKCPAVFVEAPP